MYYTRDDIAMSKFNLAEIVKACDKAGITKIEISYSGSGDDGSINETVFFPPEATLELSLIKVPQKSKKYEWDTETKDRKEEIIIREIKLEESVDDYFYDVAHRFDIDFNNEGCEGNFYINIAERKIEVENEVFYTRSESQSFDEEIDLV